MTAVQVPEECSGMDRPEKSGAAHSVAGLHLNMLLSLRAAYGWKLLGMLVFGQWLLKGVVWGFAMTGMDFLLREYAVSGPKMQIYKAVAMLPWAMKPLFGLLSDAFPIGGWRKAPYIVLVTIVAVVAHCAIGLIPHGVLEVRAIVACLLFGTLQISVVDLLTEARYAEKIREVPAHGPDLMTFVWGGITLGHLVALASVGFVLEHWGAHSVYALVVAPAALILIPTTQNWLEEVRHNPEEVQQRRTCIAEQRELFALVLIVGGASLGLVFVGLLQESVWVSFLIALTAAAVVVCAFLCLLRPIISLVNCFFFIQTACALDISGASFYFFTDDSHQFPNGPGFSKVFFASGIGVFVALLNLQGMAIYNKYMQAWGYHGLFIFANVLLCVLNLASSLVFLRWNCHIGIPDSVFVLGTWGAWGIVNMWMWLPGVVLTSHLCPSGLEATMYALLAGCHNLGLSVASYGGACLLEVLGVSPNGSPNEAKQFDNLWIASFVSALLPMLTLFLMPCMIPDAKQTDTLLEPGASATAGAPLSRLRAWTAKHTGGRVDDGDQDVVRFPVGASGGYGATAGNVSALAPHSTP